MSEKQSSAYADAGVNIDAANKAVDGMKDSIRSTHNPRVITDIGLFGGLLDVSFLREYKHPVLVQSIDGVGTKMMIAEEMERFTVGRDLVHHCVNDILCQGALPISFLDYMASAKLKPAVMQKIVAEMAGACKEIGVPIIGGETAEMPGVYKEDRHDLVGCITGVVEKNRIIDGSKIEPGDVLIGLPSSGLHTNGYSLARKAIFEIGGYSPKEYLSMLNCKIGDELLKVHKSYYKPLTALILGRPIEIHGIAHITGGGFDNIGRLLKNGLRAEIFCPWKIPPVFELIQTLAKVSNQEMRRVFNLGIGIVIIVPLKDVKHARGILASLGELTHKIIGIIEKVTPNSEKVVFTY